MQLPTFSFCAFASDHPPVFLNTNLKSTKTKHEEDGFNIKKGGKWASLLIKIYSFYIRIWKRGGKKDLHEFSFKRLKNLCQFEGNNRSPENKWCWLLQQDCHHSKLSTTGYIWKHHSNTSISKSYKNIISVSCKSKWSKIMVDDNNDDYLLILH